MEYYSEIKREELPSHNKTWRKFKCVLLCERNQFEKVTCCSIPTIWLSRKGKTRLIVKTPVISGGSGEHERAGGKSR